MQSIDKIRQTNELSRVLRSHGLASDGFDAMEQANEMVNDEPSQIFGTERAESRALQKVQNLERSKHLLNQRVDALQAQLESVQAKLKDLHQRFEGTESKLRTMRQSQQVEAVPQAPVAQPRGFPRAAVPQAAVPQTPVNEGQSNPQSAAAQQPAAAQPTSQSKNNNGFGPSDVAIDKIFYCGER